MAEGENIVAVQNGFSDQPVQILGYPEGKEKRGGTFVGWNTAPDGTGTPYAPGDMVRFDLNATLYAQWDMLQVTVTFDANGGVLSGDSTRTFDYGSSVGAAPGVARIGYYLLGWYDNLEGGTQLTEDTEATSNVTYYAKWTPNKYTVTFNPNITGGTVSMPSKQVTYDEPYGEMSTPTCTGYIFSGWYTASTGGNVVGENDIFQETSDQTLYAHWTEDNIDVIFHRNPPDHGEDITITLHRNY